MSVYGKNEGLLPDPRHPEDKHLARIKEIFGHLSYLTDDQKRRMAEHRRRLAAALNAFKTPPEAKI